MASARFLQSLRVLPQGQRALVPRSQTAELTNNNWWKLRSGARTGLCSVSRAMTHPQGGFGLRTFCGHPDFAPESKVDGAENDEVQDKLKKLVTDNKVVLFMKGSPDAPQCGFSRAVAQVLQVEDFQDYAYVDVLKYPEVREGVKKFSDWPTIPQLYVKGEFVGGCDIVVQMHRDGELKPMLDEAR
mmetsp:Transcript_54406/g.129656  ORF Transcript_54406/g.129656 Transcript_54406/m.129656 type:complete len:186 (+) Transcript_54406:118-675(+)|eukprot:CAMPEP_0178454208 /NCGR_PEP_ID=MMETSP0689_2-20121128/45230_1 /TAXON_ID=160604 /ORGANISM="Amphidinium massartii, Strain CS-259" /LENGTH=185 /DNA_ID=CAMNT_0020080115 /DNA_START=102 /DNA_END=659 /DNA_ORIENTATION=-